MTVCMRQTVHDAVCAPGWGVQQFLLRRKDGKIMFRKTDRESKEILFKKNWSIFQKMFLLTFFVDVAANSVPKSSVN